MVARVCLELRRWSRLRGRSIAVVIRTLVHDTSVSRGLLSQLNLRDEIPWLSAVEPTGTGFAGPPWVDSPVEPEFRHIPGMPAFECTFREWWRGRMLQFNGTAIDRSWFVLTTANFDGGAHVDPVLPPDYHSITREGGLNTVRINSAGDPYPDSTDRSPVLSAPSVPNLSSPSSERGEANIAERWISDGAVGRIPAPRPAV